MLVVTGAVLGGILGWLGYVLATNDSVGRPALNITIAVLIGLVVMIIGVILAMRDSTYNRNVYPDAYARWIRSWQCQRCGTVFLG